MKLTIELRMTGEVATDAGNGYEVARILRDTVIPAVEGRWVSPGDDFPLMDATDKQVGSIKVAAR